MTAEGEKRPRAAVCVWFGLRVLSGCDARASKQSSWGHRVEDRARKISHFMPLAQARHLDHTTRLPSPNPEPSTIPQTQTPRTLSVESFAPLYLNLLSRLLRRIARKVVQLGRHDERKLLVHVPQQAQRSKCIIKNLHGGFACSLPPSLASGLLLR